MTRRSSGILAYQQDENVACLACDWTGDVEVTVDPEIRTLLWHCPSCTTEFEEEL